MSLDEKGFQPSIKNQNKTHSQLRQSIIQSLCKNRPRKTELENFYKKHKSAYAVQMVWYADNQILSSQVIALDQWWGTLTLDRLETKHRPEEAKHYPTTDMEVFFVGPESQALFWILENEKALRQLKVKLQRRSVNMRQMYVLLPAPVSFFCISLFEKKQIGEEAGVYRDDHEVTPTAQLAIAQLSGAKIGANE
ncbi:MAG: hypothetical protein AAFR71_10605 [Pseudomonadota bacterium]